MKSILETISEHVNKLSTSEKQELARRLMNTTVNFVGEATGSLPFFNHEILLNHLTNGAPRVPENHSDDIFEENALFEQCNKKLTVKEKRQRNKNKIKVNIPSKKELAQLSKKQA